MKRRNVWITVIAVLGVLLVAVFFSGGIAGLRFRLGDLLESLGVNEEYSSYSTEAVKSANATRIAISCTAINDRYISTSSESVKGRMRDRWEGWMGGVCSVSEEGLRMGGPVVECPEIGTEGGCRVEGFRIPSKGEMSPETSEPVYAMYYEAAGEGSYTEPVYSFEDILEELNYGLEGMDDVERTRMLIEAKNKAGVESFSEVESVYPALYLSGEGFEKVLKVRMYSEMGVLDEDFVSVFENIVEARKKLSGTSFENIRKYDSIRKAYMEGESPFRETDPEMVLAGQLEDVVNQTDIDLVALVESMEILRDKKIVDTVSEEVSGLENGSELERYIQDSETVEYADEIDGNFSSSLTSVFRSFHGRGKELEGQKEFYTEASGELAEDIFVLGQTGDVPKDMDDLKGYSSYQYFDRVLKHSRDLICGSEGFETLEGLSDTGTLISSVTGSEVLDGSQGLKVISGQCGGFDYQSFCGSEGSVESFESRCEAATLMAASEVVSSAERAARKPGNLNSLYLKKRGWNSPREFELHPSTSTYMVGSGGRRLYLTGDASGTLEFGVGTSSCSPVLHSFETEMSREQDLPEGRGLGPESMSLGKISRFRGSYLNLPERCMDVEEGCETFHRADIKGGGIFPAIIYLGDPYLYTEYNGSSQGFRFSDTGFKEGSQISEYYSDFSGSIERYRNNLRSLEQRKNRQAEIFRSMTDEDVRGELWREVYGFTQSQSCENTEPGFNVDCEAGECRTSTVYRGDPRQYIDWSDYCNSFVANTSRLRETVTGRGSGPLSQLGYWEVEGDPRENMYSARIPRKGYVEGMTGKKVCGTDKIEGLSEERVKYVGVMGADPDGISRGHRIPDGISSLVEENPVIGSEVFSALIREVRSSG